LEDTLAVVGALPAAGIPVAEDSRVEVVVAATQAVVEGPRLVAAGDTTDRWRSSPRH